VIGAAQACELEDVRWAGESHQDVGTDPAVRRDGFLFNIPGRWTLMCV